MTPKPLSRSLLTLALSVVISFLPAGALAESCETGQISLTATSACLRTGPESFLLEIRPEASPINPSPWYAFTLSAEEPAEVTVVLDYGPFRHRYHPKKKESQATWMPLDAGSLQVMPDGRRAEIRLSLETGVTSVAAQAVLSAQEREDWAKDYAGRWGFSLSEIGVSTEQRPILALRGGSDRPGAPLLVILGGQHPPEVPGMSGLRSFLETLAADGGRLLETHAVLAIPDLNPDGAAHGHWRLNRGMTDLNRDWGPFTQPETQAVRDELDRLISAGLRPVVLLDFHATRRDVYYTPSHEDALCPSGFASAWIGEIGVLLGNEPLPAVSASHVPGQGTAKTWFAERFGAPGITVEYGDETPAMRIRSLSEAGARALISILSDLDRAGEWSTCAVQF